MRKTTIGASVVATALVGASALLSSTAANAAVGDTVCNYSTDLNDHVLVTQVGEWSYRVSITDFRMGAGMALAGDRYVPLPTEPINLRTSENRVAFNPAFTVSDLAISQSVESGPSDDGSGVVVNNYLLNAPSPEESVSITGNEIIWMQDIDAYTDANGVQVTPDELPFFALLDPSAGVLQFTVTIPEGTEGEVLLFDGMSATYMGTKTLSQSDVWEADVEHTALTDGCQITLESTVTPDPDPDPDPDPSPDPDPKPEPKPDPKPEPGKKPETDELAATGGPEPTSWALAATAITAAGIALTTFGLRRTKSADIS